MKTRILGIKAKPRTPTYRRIKAQRVGGNSMHRASPLIQQSRIPVLTACGDAALAMAHADLMIQAKAVGPIQARDVLHQLQQQYGNSHVQRVLEVSRQGKGKIAHSPKTARVTQGNGGVGRSPWAARYSIKSGAPGKPSKVTHTLQRSPLTVSQVCKEVGSYVTVPPIVTIGAQRRKKLKLDKFTCERSGRWCRITMGGKRLRNPRRYYKSLDTQRRFQKRYIGVMSKYVTQIANLKQPYSHFKKKVEDRDKKFVRTYMQVIGFKVVRLSKSTDPFFDWAAQLHEKQHVKLKRMKFREFRYKELNKLKRDAIKEVGKDIKSEQRLLASSKPKTTNIKFFDRWRLKVWRKRFLKRRMALIQYTQRRLHLLSLHPPKVKNILALIKKHRQEVGQFSARRYRELGRFIGSISGLLRRIKGTLQSHWQKWHNRAVNYVCDDLMAYRTSLQAMKRAMQFLKQCCWPRKSR